MSHNELEILADTDEANLPSRMECEERCQTFAEITNTDTALAMYYLQDRDWDVQRAVDDYFNANREDTGTVKKSQISSASLTDPSRSTSLKDSSVSTSLKDSSVSTSLKDPSVSASLKDSSVSTSLKDSSVSTSLKEYIGSGSDGSKACLTTCPPLLQPQSENRIRILSWNIDGLDRANLQSRTEGVCSVLLLENPEVIFLQEVVDDSLKILKAKCVNFHFFLGAEDKMRVPGAYYTAMLLREDVVQVDCAQIAEFPKSLMDRTLLEVQCKVKGIPMTLMTSHLESTAEYSEERVRQLRMAFKRMNSLSAEQTIIFGGDLNLRDKEVKGLNTPLDIRDIWEITGKRQEAKFTWDLTINDNKQLGGRFQPRCRFDRLYIKHGKTAAVKPVYFELVGIQRLASCHRFPSDHWGIMAHFDVLNKS
ncbi:tyrosyl-DNA phosphodiesterase 2-like [Physella acuta]|uniref:tyrosyl-DNA phosphodiesterase 2-like n=1 Tax=Physella acuta TaxID=109671 RepID=UPI0027DDD637|nr:tyrosyl-DNA phosphodiesterase 2-like [Physella acuta]